MRSVGVNGAGMIESCDNLLDVILNKYKRQRVIFDLVLFFQEQLFSYLLLFVFFTSQFLGPPLRLFVHLTVFAKGKKNNLKTITFNSTSFIRANR